MGAAEQQVIPRYLGWNMEWNDGMEMEWNSEHTQLQLTRVTGAAQPRLNYLVYL